MMHTERVNREIANVAEKYPGTEVVDEPNGGVALIIPALPIPSSFTSPTARILVRVPPLYPTEKLDLFWLTPTLKRSNGAGLLNVMAEGVAIADEQWTQISWHNSDLHDPNRVSVIGFVRGILQWFESQILLI